MTYFYIILKVQLVVLVTTLSNLKWKKCEVQFAVYVLHVTRTEQGSWSGWEGERRIALPSAHSLRLSAQVQFNRTSFHFIFSFILCIYLFDA